MKLKLQHGLSFDSVMLLTQGRKLWLPLALPVRKTALEEKEWPQLLCCRAAR